MLGKSVELPDDFEWAADVDGNGHVESVDFANMRAKLLGMIALFPKERPTVPSNVKVVLQTVSGIILEWDESTGLTDISHYEVYRDGAYYKDSTTNSFEDTGLTKNTTYIYELVAVDTKGRKSNKSNATEVSFEGLGDAEPPSAPTNFKVNWYTGVAASLTWDTPVDDTAIEGYEVYSSNTLLTFVKDTSVIYTGLTCNTSYTLTVKAVDVYGNRSADSNEVAFTTGSDDYGNSDTNTVFLKLGEENKISGVLENKTDNDCFLFKPPASGFYRIEIINETDDKEIIGFLRNDISGQSFSTWSNSSDNFYYIKEILFNNNTYKLSVKYTNEILKDDGYSVKYDKYTIVAKQVSPDWTVEKISSDATEIEIGTEISGNVSNGQFFSYSDYFKFNIPENGYYILEHSEGISSQICDSDNEFPLCKKVYTDENLKKYYFEEGDYYVKIYTKYNKSFDYTFKLYKAKPDFRIRRISPSVVIQGNSVELEAIVDNRGHEYIDGENTFRVGFVIDDVNTVYSDYCTQAIGENKEIVLSATADASLFNKLGSHTVSAFIEKVTEFEEIDENNNTLDTEIFTDDYPDKKEESRIISVNENIEGSIAYKGDCDWFAFIPENGYYIFEHTGGISSQIYDSDNEFQSYKKEYTDENLKKYYFEEGDYYVRIYTEYNASEYTFKLYKAKPDFRIRSISPSVVLQGNSVALEAIVDNRGHEYIDGENTFRVGFVIDDVNTVYSDYCTQAIGENKEIVLSATADASLFNKLGSHTVSAFIEKVTEFEEIDENNNTLDTEIFTDDYPDKKEESRMISVNENIEGSIGFNGDYDWLTFTPENDGYYRIVASCDEKISKEIEVCLGYSDSNSILRLGYLSAEKNSMSILRNFEENKTYYIRFSGSIGNYKLSIDYAKPDLDITQVSPVTILAGEETPFSVTVKNIGDIYLDANSFRVGIKLDDSEDIIWSSYNSKYLGVNSTITLNVVGCFYTVGEHTITVVVDYTNDLFDDNGAQSVSKPIYAQYLDLKLKVSNITPTHIGQDNPVQFTVGVTNSGDKSLRLGKPLKVILKDKNDNILAYGESSSFNKGSSNSVLLDKGGTDGNGSVIFDKVGAAEVVAYVESCEEDSIYQKEISVIEKPNLEILDITFSPESIGLNEQVSFKVNVGNQSSVNLNANLFRVGIKLDDSEDIIWSSYNSSLSANGTTVLSVRGLFNTSGEHTVTAFIDYNSNISKEKETEGFSKTIFLRHPDLQVTNISPKYVIIGDSTQFTVDVINNESVLRTGQLLKIVLKDKDENILAYGEVDSFIDKGKSISVLLDKGGTDGNGNVVINELGITEIAACVDTENVIEEWNEENNSYQTEINIVKKPDLKVLDITYSPVEVKEGEKVVFKAQVKNCSDGRVLPSKLKVNFKVDAGTVISSGIYDKEIFPNETVEFTAVTPWTAILGEYNVTAIVDEENLVIETDDSNNSYSERMLVEKKPDLIVTDISYLPEVPKVADEIVFRATIKNIGEGSSPAGRVHRVGFKIDGSETLLWSDHFSWALEPGESITVDAIWGQNGSDKWTATEGIHTVTAEVNDTRLMEEADYVNNSYSEIVNINSISMLNLYDDYDNDGIDNATEIELGTNLMSNDTDGDGISDSEELRILSNPILPDSDGDGILDGNEQKLGLNLFVADENKSVTRTCTTSDESVIVTAYGDLNIKTKPFKVIANDNTLLKSLKGVVGSPVDISIGNNDIESATITFKYNPDETNGMDENNLKIYWVDVENNMLVPVESHVDTTNKTVTCEVEHFSTYIMGEDLDTVFSKTDIVFTVDVSGSMSSSDPNGYRLKAISRFFSDMDILKFRIGIVEYNSGAYIRHGISENKDSLVSTFKSVSSSGGTNFEAGLRKSEELFKNSSDRNKVIVFLSDGQDGGSSAQVLNTSTELYSEGINIYTIALGKGANVNLMKSMASAGGGTSFYIDSANQIENVYRQIIAMIDLRGYTSTYGSYQPGYVIMYDLTTEQQVVKVGDIQTKLNDGWTFYPRTGNEPKVTVKERDYTEITWTVENAKYKALKVTNCEKEELVQSSIIYENGDFTTKSLTPNYLYRAEILGGSVVLDSEYVYTKVSFEDGNAVGWAKYNLDKLGYGGLKGSEDIFTEEKDAKFNAAVNNFIEAFNLVADYEEAGQDEDMLYNWIKMAANNLGTHRNIRLSADKRNLVNLSGEDLYIDFAAEFYELGAIPEVIDNFSICIAPSKLLLRGNVIDKYILMPRDELISTRKMGSPSVKLISPDTLAIYNEIDGITIKAEGKNCAYIYAYVNGKRFTVQEGNNLTCKFIPSAEGLYRIYVEGKNAPEAKGTTVRTKEISVLVRFTTESITRYSQLNFNGSNWVVLGDDSKLKPESEITVAMWIKPSSTQNSSATVISCEGEKLGYEIRQDGNETNRYVFSYWDVAGKEFITDSVALEPDCWQHIAVQKTKSGLDSYLWFYVNGERIGLGAQYGNIRYANNSDVYLGTNGPGSRNFKGSLDDVGIWNRELSKEEIQQIRNKGAASNTDGLVTIVKNNAISQSTEVKNRDLDFDGNYGVNLGATDRVIPGKSMTVAMWVRPLSHKTSNANIISCEANNSGYAIEQTGKLSSNYAFKYWNGEEWKNTKSIGLNAGAWQHIAVSVSEDGEISFILNGGEKIEYSYGEINWKDTQLYLGSEGFKGSMHQVGIWNRQLTLEEIAAVMENGPQAKPYGLTQVCQNSSSNFVKNEVEALEYILSDLSFDHLGSVSFPDGNTISFTGGTLKKPDGSIYKYTYTFPIKARLLDGDYYATEDALRNSIASFLAKKSEEGVYVTEYELEGSQYLYNMACEPLYASMLYDTGDNVTLEEFINAMGPQWEIEFADISREPDIRELIHIWLDIAGMIPVVGWVFDGVNAGIYFVEGDVLNGCISMIGTIDLWGGCYVLKMSLKNGDSLSKIAVKKLSGCISRLKTGGNVLDDIASAKRIVDGYEFVTSDGIIFKVVDDKIKYSSKNLIKAMANSTDEVITCLKTKPEALFGLIKETEKLDDGIFFKFIDGTEVKIFKSDLTDEMHAALVGENGLLVTGDCTEEMAKAFDDAVKNAKARGITDVDELIGIGKTVAEAVDRIKNNLINRIAGESGFLLRYSEKEISDIVIAGKNLGLDEKAIEDFMFTGSRVEKAIDSGELMLHMDNYVNIVSKRGFPFKFDSLQNFGDFKTSLKSLLQKYNIPIEDVRIQGSSVRTPGANDVDLGVFVNESKFNELYNEMKAGIESRTTEGSAIRKSLLEGLEKGKADGRINSYYFDRVNGSGGATFGQELFELVDYTNMGRVWEPGKGPFDLSVIMEGRGFDVGPFLNCTN